MKNNTAIIILFSLVTFLLISCKNYDDLRKEAYELKEKGQLQESILVLSKAIDREPQNPKAIIERGFYYASGKQYDQAIEDYSKALSLDSANQFAYFNRGKCCVKINKYDRALTDFNKAYAYSKNDKTKRQGGILGQLNGFSDEEQKKSSAYEYDVELSRILYERGQINFDLKKFENAIKDFQEYNGYSADTLILYKEGLAWIELKDTISGCRQLNLAASKGSVSARTMSEFICK